MASHYFSTLPMVLRPLAAWPAASDEVRSVTGVTCGRGGRPQGLEETVEEANLLAGSGGTLEELQELLGWHTTPNRRRRRSMGRARKGRPARLSMDATRDSLAVTSLLEE